jgi:UDP-N-acetylglucosamine 3-dehydrogenase
MILSKNFRVGLIGFGNMGRNHARVLDFMDETKLVGIFDPGFAGKSLVFENLKCESIDQLAQMDLDYCVIATPTNTHADLACYLGNLKINLLIEKPIAINSSDAQLIIDCASKNGIKIAVGHIERFNSAMIEARKRIGLGQLGKIIQIVSSRQGPSPMRIKDVGVIEDLATHDLDSVVWLMDSGFSKISAEIIKKDISLKEDGLFLIGELKNGVKVSMIVNWINPVKERKTIIVGEQGTFIVDTLNSTLVFYENSAIDLTSETISTFVGASQGNIQQYAFEKTEALKTEHKNMLKFLTNASHSSCSISEAKKILDTVDLIFESDSLGQTVFA